MSEFIDHFSFRCSQYPEEMFRVTSFRGIEELSRPYRFEIELVSPRPDAEFDVLLENRVAFRMKKKITLTDGSGATRKSWCHGVLSSFELQGRIQGKYYGYRAVLVPYLHRLSVQFQSVIYVEKTVPDIIEEILKRNNFSTDDYELSVEGSFPKREYTVQYQESDLDFLHRLCEHEGISYFFRQEEEKERVIFEDSADNYPSIPDTEEIPYREEITESASVADSLERQQVSRFFSRKITLPGKVQVKEFNWRKPSLNLAAEHTVAENSVYGSWYDYGNHYKSTQEGAYYAKIRAQEFACRQLRFTGTSTASGFQAGFVFSLSDHFRDQLNTRYLLTSIEHKGGNSLDIGEGTAGNSFYGNEFEAMPAEIPFRPERTTPKPRIHGTLNAKIDASGSGEYAEIDDLGRYKVILPFDLSGKDKGKASRFIRMAQPYAGEGMGMHFPLHKGTEVMLVHTNGDPDRPIIAAAVPNTETTSPVTSGNQTQSQVQTGGGNKIQIEDNQGNQKIHLSSPTSKTTFTIGKF